MGDSWQHTNKPSHVIIFHTWWGNSSLAVSLVSFWGTLFHGASQLSKTQNETKQQISWFCLVYLFWSVWSLTLSPWCCWRFKPPRMWHRIDEKFQEFWRTVLPSKHQELLTQIHRFTSRKTRSSFSLPLKWSAFKTRTIN